MKTSVIRIHLHRRLTSLLFSLRILFLALLLWSLWHHLQTATGSMGRHLMKCQQPREKRGEQRPIAKHPLSQNAKSPGKLLYFRNCWRRMHEFRRVGRAVCAAAAINFHPTKLKPSKCT